MFLIGWNNYFGTGFRQSFENHPIPFGWFWAQASAGPNNRVCERNCSPSNHMYNLPDFWPSRITTIIRQNWSPSKSTVFNNNYAITSYDELPRKESISYHLIISNVSVFWKWAQVVEFAGAIVVNFAITDHCLCSRTGCRSVPYYMLHTVGNFGLQNGTTLKQNLYKNGCVTWLCHWLQGSASIRGR